MMQICGNIWNLFLLDIPSLIQFINRMNQFLLLQNSSKSTKWLGLLQPAPSGIYNTTCECHNICKTGVGAVYQFHSKETHGVSSIVSSLMEHQLWQSLTQCLTMGSHCRQIVVGQQKTIVLHNTTLRPFTVMCLCISEREPLFTLFIELFI